MSNFKKFFFFQYWDIVQKRGVEYSGLQVTVATSFIFDYLRIERESNGWDTEELKYLCLAIDASCEVLNPNNFTFFPAAYLDEIKSYYIQNHDRHNGWIFTI